MKKVAVIGVGIMGKGIASNFLKRGYTVYVWNRHPDKLKELVKKGAQQTYSPKEAVESADIIFEVTANDESSRSVWLKDNGILAGANSKKTLISCATLSVSWTEELVKLCNRKNLTFFDMPMTGGRWGAENGRLILLAGGDKNKLSKIEKDLKAVSERVIYFGKGGSGMKFKLLLNMLQAIHIAGLGEVINLAKETKLDIKAVGDALAERPGGTSTNIAWRDYQKEPRPINFSVKWIAKDLKYAKKLSKTLKTPLLDEVLKKYQMALNQKLGDRDWTVINKGIK